MHGWTAGLEQLAEEIFDYTRDRMRLDPVPLDGPREPAELKAAAGATITAEGLGGEAALRLFAEVLAPACISVDHPRHLSFVPCAPTEASTLFDLVVGASSICGSSWLEGAGAVYAENQALDWIATLAGLPEGSGGAFVQGGTLANLSALVAAREQARAGEADTRPGRFAVVAGSEAHASIAHAARVMDVEVLPVAPRKDGRLDGDGVAGAVDRAREAGYRVFAVVASAGTTNLGIVDDLASVAEAAAERGLWLHVDGAYGGAAMVAPATRPLFDGVERADSLVVDPHKWLFAPYDCAALLYRHPETARRAHTQHAGYLDPVERGGRWNPSDYAVHLTRRARGLPFWFSLAAHGTEAYRLAVERTLEVARYAARAVEASTYLELVREPDLSVVCFTRTGWSSADYYAWSDRLLKTGTAFVLPTTIDGEAAARLAVVNPRTGEADVDLVLHSMR